MSAISEAEAAPDAFSGFWSRRSVVYGTKGIVSTTSPLATQAGLRTLREGGNATDAAVAAAVVLNVVDPSMTGIGGDAFALIYEAASHKVSALNGSGRSAEGATLDTICQDLGITDRQHGTMPNTSALSVTVPGSAAAWVDLVEKFGSGKVSLAQVMAPAIELAEGGCTVSEIASYWWADKEDDLRKTPNGTQVLQADPDAPDGFRAPRPGELYRNPRLAKTLRAVAERGKAGFYDGPVAKAVVNVIRELGGYLSLEDLKRHGKLGSELTEALPLHLGGRLFSHFPNAPVAEIDLWEHPPNGQGVVAQIALGILLELEKQGKVPEFTRKDHNSAEYLHILIQILRIAFADGTWFITDPATSLSTAHALLSPAYLAERAKLFDATRAAKSPLPSHGYPNPALKPSDTVYLAATDAAGNACSLVNSVADTFGARIVPNGTGFALHCRGSGFHLDPAHPNAYAPGKRPYNTIMPALVTRPDSNAGGGDSLLAALGVMGGAMQPQGHVQVLLNMALFGLDEQAAVDAPRLCIGVSIPGKATDPSKRVDETVYLEDGIREDVARQLEVMGYEVKIVRGMGRALFGRGQIITVRHDDDKGQRVYAAGSDMRGDGAAAPLV